MEEGKIIALVIGIIAALIGVYFKEVNLYLRDCAASHKKLALHWKTA